MSDTIKINTSTNMIISYTDLPIVNEFNPILKRPTAPFDFKNPQVDPVWFASSLFHTMLKHKSLGLTANQVGYSLGVFTVGYENSNKQVFFNPRIVEVSPETEKYVEGCLTYPELFLKVERPKWIVISFQHVDGTLNERRYEHLTARVILHCMDYINGENFTQKVGETSLAMARYRRGKKAQ